MEMPSLDGKVCLITGATSGIGKVTARDLTEVGATVVIICRNKGKGEAARTEILQKSPKAKIDLIVVDLSELAQVRRAAAEFKERYSRLDVLINNAGGINSEHKVTSEGLEYTFATNCLAPFLLTDLLLDTLKASAPSRIINISSKAHEQGQIDFDDLQSERKYSFGKAYGQSKLAQLFYTYELAERLEGSDVTVNALHPGMVSTGFNNGLKGIFHVIGAVIYAVVGINAEKGAVTTTYLATSPEVAQVSGKYFVKSKEAPSSKLSYDPTIRQRLWAVSENLIRRISQEENFPATTPQ